MLDLCNNLLLLALGLMRLAGNGGAVGEVPRVHGGMSGN
jgi:hypothetical protein